MMDQCPFCKIIKEGKDVFYEDENTAAFLDANPSAPGHTLVVPKKHCPTILEMDEELLAKVFETVKKITKMIKKGLNPDGFNIGLNQGAPAGQRVPHLHVHILPRFEGDKGGAVQMVVRNPPQEEGLDSIAQKIKSGSSKEIPEHIKEQIEDESEEEETKKEEKELTQEEKEILKKAKQIKPPKQEQELEEHEKEETEKQEKEYKGKKDIKDKEEEELEKYEKILREMKIPR